MVLRNVQLHIAGTVNFAYNGSLSSIKAVVVEETYLVLDQNPTKCGSTLYATLKSMFFKDMHDRNVNHKPIAVSNNPS